MRFIFLVVTWGLLSGLAWAEAPKANLGAFRKEIEPVLKRACVECHGCLLYTSPSPRDRG